MNCYVCHRPKENIEGAYVTLRCHCMVDERFEEMSKEIKVLKDTIKDLYEKINNKEVEESGSGS